jgi:hypothetical protein
MKPRGEYSWGRPGAAVALALLLGLALPGCGKEAAREAPPQTGRPSEPAPPPPAEPTPPAEPGVSPEMLDKDRAADEAPAAAPSAPPRPASKPAAPSGRGAPRAASPPPSKAARETAPEGDLDFGVGGEAPLTPQLLYQRLDGLVKQSTPDCPSARDRKQAICDLAGQICQMVEHDPDVASVESYCDDAKHRCSEAERRTAQRCK